MRGKVALLSAVLFLFSCATIFQSVKQNVSISSEPSQAKITIDQNGEKIFEGTTPQIVNLKKGKNVLIKFQKEGFQDLIVPLKKKVAGGFVFDILLLSPLGLIVDLSDGAYVEYHDKVFVNLETKEVKSSEFLKDEKSLYASVVFYNSESNKPCKIYIPLKKTSN
jgi:hypothetical protein